MMGGLFRGGLGGVELYGYECGFVFRIFFRIDFRDRVY